MVARSRPFLGQRRRNHAPGMRGMSVLAVTVAATALVSGCGSRPAGTVAAGAAGSPTAAGRASPTAFPGTPAAPGCHGSSPAVHRGVVVLRNDDSYRSFCVRRGTVLLVYLKGTAASRWSAIHASSAALVPRPGGPPMMLRGVTGGSFVAARAGTAVLSSFRYACGSTATPPPNAGSPPGTPECGAILGFRVTVTVT